MSSVNKKSILRIIDANLNRSREGIRVCEDITRFVLNSAGLTQELKIVRHRISRIAGRAGLKALCESRDSRGDVDKASKLHGLMKRATLSDIFSANIERVKESLRVLEEIFKIIDVKAAAEFSVLRFKVYTIEKKAIKKIWSLRDTR